MQNTVLLSTAFAEDIIQFTVFFSGPQGVFPECQRFFVGKSIPGRPENDLSGMWFALRAYRMMQYDGHESPSPRVHVKTSQPKDFS